MDTALPHCRRGHATAACRSTGFGAATTPGAARGIPPAAYQTPTYQPAQHPAPGQQAYPPPPPSAYPQYGVPPVGYAAPQQTNVSGLVLTIISGLLVFSCYFTLIGLPSFIIGIIAMTKQNTDWEGSRRLARIGWIVLGSLFALAILAVIAFIVIGVATDTSQY